MSLFVVFIFGAVLLGAGAMLSPAWRTAQPRIALSAAFCLALLTGGAVFYTEAFGWDTLVIDYLLFALLSGVVLGGTLSTAQARAEARGERLQDHDLGWPGPEDLAFFALVALLVIMPLFHLAAPLGTQGQVTGFHSLTTRDGESFNSLAPFAPQAPVVIAPGFHALSAYLSLQLDHTIPLIQLSVSAVVVFLLLWLAYDFGAELSDKRLGRAMTIALLLCFGIHRSFLDGHFSELLALLFMQAFALYAIRLLRRFNLADLAAGGLMMGAVITANLSLSLVMLFGFLSLLSLAWLDRRRAITMKSRISLTVGLPLVALLGIAPWLINNLPHILPISPSPFTAEMGNFAHLTRGQGFVILPLALFGIWMSLRMYGRLRFVSWLMLIWLLLVVEASLVGALGSLLPPLGALTNAPNIARHGIILPYAWFGGIALLQIWDGSVPTSLKRRLRRSAYRLMALTAVLILLAGGAFQPILDAFRPLLDLPHATISDGDIVAMAWLRENTAPDAVVMAADGKAWLPVFAERRALDFNAVRTFEWDYLRRNAEGVDQINFVLVSSGAEPPADMHLDVVFYQDDVRVYEVSDEQDTP
ncbi:MAG: hypothetical protein OXG78_02785 [Chloroflexi bacterium]|nr:hypothetical protein [Chloroflexota bacterium]